MTMEPFSQPEPPAMGDWDYICAIGCVLGGCWWICGLICGGGCAMGGGALLALAAGGAAAVGPAVAAGGAELVESLFGGGEPE